jgi:hypothetical protein
MERFKKETERLLPSLNEKEKSKKKPLDKQALFQSQSSIEDLDCTCHTGKCACQGK